MAAIEIELGYVSYCLSVLVSFLLRMKDLTQCSSVTRLVTDLLFYSATTADSCWLMT